LEDYQFHEGPVPDGYQQGTEPAIFNTPQHRALQAVEGWHSFYALNEKRRLAVAAVHFHIARGEAHSPLKSPFGSVELAPGVLPLVVFRFLEFVESRLKSRGAQRIRIKHYPSDYNAAESALLHTFLINLDYQVVDAEAGAIITVTDHVFETTLDTWERRKLRQGAASGLQGRELLPSELKMIYEFIHACRGEKGYALSMSLAEIQDAARIFEKEFILFGIFHEERLVAASIAIRVNRKVLYNFYAAHEAEFDSLSPVVFLIDRLYGYCRQHNIALLDLGTSAIDGKPNFGLLDFKLRLGAKPTTKFTFEKTLV
jgi:hypothetical protein